MSTIVGPDAFVPAKPRRPRQPARGRPQRLAPRRGPAADRHVRASRGDLAGLRRLPLALRCYLDGAGFRRRPHHPVHGCVCDRPRQRHHHADRDRPRPTRLPALRGPDDHRRHPAGRRPRPDRVLTGGADERPRRVRSDHRHCTRHRQGDVCASVRRHLHLVGDEHDRCDGLGPEPSKPSRRCRRG